MTDFLLIDLETDNPEPTVQHYCQRLLDGVDDSTLMVITYPYSCYWLPDQPVVELSAVYFLEKRLKGVEIRFLVAEKTSGLINWLQVAVAEKESILERVQSHFSLPVITASQAIPLLSLNIPKPWGQEIWYTGIEERGVASVGSVDFQQLLPWVLSALPDTLCAGQQRSLILLKILDPLPEPVFGDLYFELHQQKREVYVVTAVNEQAWPTGAGEIRFGFDQAKRDQYSDSPSFRQAFAEAVKAYEVVRREVDQLLDEKRLEAGKDLNEPVSASCLAAWMDSVADPLKEQEARLRAEMESFTDKLSLKVGDVVKVPCLTPHSLQHGVRTVEFQTPVYERLIVSFAQKVLTQQHWDTDKAIELMSIEGESQQSLELLSDTKGVTVERIVDFEDFEVRRIVVDVGASISLPHPDSYGLLMAVSGDIKLQSVDVAPEQAVLLPKGWSGEELINNGDGSMSFLLAYPK